jgi:hypothetical protein
MAVIVENVKSCFEPTLRLWRNPLECVPMTMTILRDMLGMSRDLIFGKVVTDLLREGTGSIIRAGCGLLECSTRILGVG